MDAQVGQLMSTLKQQLKAKRLNYRDVASRLKVSEATVKRYFNGKGVTVGILQRLAEVVDLDILSLVILAKDQAVVQRSLTKSQHAALKRRGPTSATFFMMLGGWTPTQVAAEFGLDDEIDTILTRLESLGLIRKLRGRAVQILVRPDLSRKAYGPMAELAIEAAQQFLRNLNLREEKCEWIFYPARASQASIGELREMIKRFQNDLRVLNRRDLSLPPDQTQWYCVFIGARPMSRSDFLRL